MLARKKPLIKIILILLIFQDIPLYTFCRNESLQLPLTSNFDQITIDPGVAGKLKPVEIKPGISLATVTGKLEVTNNRYNLEDFDSTGSQRPPKKQRKEISASGENNSSKYTFPEQYLFGEVNVSNLLQSLTAQGIATSKVEEPGPGSFIIHLDKDEALIRIEDNETHVVCEEANGSNTREIIRKCITTCLNTF